ncbi:MAG: class I SAM-dependent methyltransferase [Cyclobacteriaceae bacterium]|jgi:predicted O-methyltransferase YrrM|nr:class I SAM-dependent methyltransferase [Cyclobacteriaceae bacterium]
MNLAIFRLQSFLHHWLRCVDKHSLHSPFFFDFYLNVVEDKKPNQLAKVEALRKQLLTSSTEITFSDLGTYQNQASRTVSLKYIAGTSISPAKFSEIYLRAIRHFKAKEIVELGTSLGINTLYLANEPNTHVTTFEGVPEIATVARDTFLFADTKNITLVEGNINNTLPAYIEKCKKIDFAFIDANHRLEPCQNYFEWLLKKCTAQSILVLDDIHHSEEMETAWQNIKEHPLVYGTADLYRCGFVFPDPSLNRQHWQLAV